MKNRMRNFLAAILLFAVSASTAGAAETVALTVSPDGPISTFRQAIDEVRKIEKSDKPIIVEFKEGVYPIVDPVVFGPEDSGTERAPIVYRAAKGEKVVFSGGRKIIGWTKGADGIWTTKIPDVAEGLWYFEQLYVGEKRATRCREPNADLPDPYFYTEEKVDMAADPESGEMKVLPNRSFRATLKDIAPLQSLDKDKFRDVMFKMYHSWETSAHRVAGIDFEERVVVFTGDAAWALMNWEPRQRYHIENYREAMDRPGEWFLDRDGTLSYIPFPGEDLTKLDVVAPVAGAFLRFEGETIKEGGKGRVSNISFDGLKFHHSGYVLEPKGHSDGQAAITGPFAALMNGCDKISFENCEFAHIGGNALRFHKACTDCRFVRNYVHDIGGGGVYVGCGWDPNLDDTLPSDGNLIENCIVRNGGRFDHGAVGVWIGHGSHNKVLHNDISEFYYTGVSVGWQWGYQPTRSHHNTIEFNRIHHLGHWIMSDMGGVYTLGVSPGTTVSNNVMHDIYAYSYGGWGLYTDEGSTGIVLENNLVYRVKTGTFHQHYGKENIVRNNILAYSLTDQIQRSRIEEHLSFSLENDIILWDEGVLLGSPWNPDGMKHWGDDKVVLKNNVYWNPNADMSGVFPGGNDLETWREKSGHDQGSIVADPKFKDPKNGDFTLPDDSPVFKTGFKRFDYSKAGVYGDKDWIDTANDYDHPKRLRAPEKPKPLPLTLQDDFETPRTRPVLKGTIHDEGNHDLVRLSTDRPFKGEKCLEIGDSSKLQHAFNPHVVFVPRHETGNSTVRFALRVQKNADAHVEWRDSSQPYKIGPSFRVRDGKLYAKGTEPIEFPVDEWVRVEMNADVGDDIRNEDWKTDCYLTLNFGDGKTALVNLEHIHADWKTFDWLGFCNLDRKDEESSFFLDDLSITNQAPE